MTAVVLVGELPATGVLQTSPAARAPVRGDADYPAFIDLVAHGLQGRSAVLVLCPAWRSTEALKAVRLARSAQDSDRIAIVPLDLPPLALSLVADQVAFAAPYVKPGVLAGLADRLAHEVYAGAWVNSVAKLEHIETAFGLHVKSYLGGAFAVTAAPVHHVHRINSHRPVPAIARRPADPVIMIASGADGDLNWVRGKLAPALAVTSLTGVAPQPLSAGFWGAKKYVEFVAFSGHPQALQATVASTAFRPCGWCGESTALAQCPFCWMVQPEAEAAPAVAPQQAHGVTAPHHIRQQSVNGRPQQSANQKSWPHSASPPEVVVRSPGSDDANQPHGQASPPRPRQPGTAHPPPTSEAAGPDPAIDRSDSSDAVSFRPARQR